jgi:hypothetical protein
MADRYWLGANTDWSDTSNWSLTDGGTSGVAVPTSADDVYFTSTNVGNCTLTANSQCKSLTIQDGYTGTFASSTFDMYVAGNVSMRCTTGAVDLGSGSWLIDGDFDFRDCGTWTYTSSNIELTGVAATTVYVHGGNTSAQRLFNVTIASGANVELGSGGTGWTWQGAVDVYGTLNVPTGRPFGKSAGTLTVKNGGSITTDGTGYLSLTPVTVIVESGGSITVDKIHLRYGCSIQGEFNCLTDISWGNTAVDTDYTLTFLGLTEINCKFTFAWNRASNTGTMDLATNSAVVRVSDDVDFSTGFSAGTLVIDDAPGKFKFIGTADQSADFGGLSVDIFANKLGAGTVTFDNASDTINYVAAGDFHNLVINGPTFDCGANIEINNLTFTAGTILAGTGTWTIGGDMTLSSGVTFTCETSTFEFTNADATFTANSTIQFNNLNVVANAQLTFVSSSYVTVQNMDLYGALRFLTGSDNRLLIYQTLDIKTGSSCVSTGYGTIIFIGASAACTTDLNASDNFKPAEIEFYNTNITFPSGHWSPGTHFRLYNAAGVDTTVTFASNAIMHWHADIVFTNSGAAGDTLTLDSSPAFAFYFYEDVIDSVANGAECSFIGNVRVHGKSNQIIEMDSFAVLPTFYGFKITGSLTFRNISTVTLGGWTSIQSMNVEPTVVSFDANDYDCDVKGTWDFDCTTVDLGTGRWSLHNGSNLDISDLAIESLTYAGSEMFTYSGSTITMDAVDQSFGKVNVAGDTTVTTTGGDCRITEGLEVNGELDINGASAVVMVADCTLNMKTGGTIVGTGTLYTRDLHTGWFVGDVSTISPAQWTLYDNGTVYEIPAGEYQTVMNLWGGASGITFQFSSGVTTFHSNVYFYNLGASVMLLDMTTNSGIVSFASNVSIRDASTGEIQANSTLDLIGDSNIWIDDDRDTASTANHVMFTSNKATGKVNISGIGQPTVLTGTFSCGEFEMTGTSNIDFNDCTFNCSGDVTLNNDVDIGDATLTVGGDFDYTAIDSLTYSANGHIIMTGVGKEWIARASNTYVCSLTIAEGASITTPVGSGSFSVAPAPYTFIIEGTFIQNTTSYIRAAMYVKSTGTWTIEAGFPQLYFPGSASGLMENSGIVNGNANLYCRGFLVDSIFAPGTYSNAGLHSYGSGGGSTITFDGVYVIDGHCGIYGSDGWSAAVTFAAGCEVTITGDFQSISTATSINRLNMHAGANIRLLGDIDVPSGYILETPTIDATSFWTFYSSLDQEARCQGADIGQVVLSKPSGDTYLTDTICQLSGTTNGDVIAN